MPEGEATDLPPPGGRISGPTATGAAREGAGERGHSPPTKWSAGDFVLVFVGVACFVLSYLTFSHGSILPNRVYPLWALFIALGSIATTGGLLSIYVGPDPPSLGIDEVDLEEFVLVPRAEWASIKQRLATAEAIARAEEGIGSGGLEGGLGTNGSEAEAAGRRARSDEHRSILSDIEQLGGMGAPTAAAAVRPPTARASQGASGIPLERPALASRFPVGPTPTTARSTGLPPGVEVETPKVGEVEPEALRSTLDSQLQGVLETSAGAPASREAPPVPLPPTPGKAVPAARRPRPSEGSSPPEAAPIAHPPESYSEDDEEEPSTVSPERPAASPGAAEPSAPIDEIEALAKMFASVAQPAGALIEKGTPPPPPSQLPLEPLAEPKRFRGLAAQRPAASAPKEEWEAAALRAAIDYCITRKEDEPVNAFMSRVTAQLQAWTRTPPPPQSEIERAEAFVGDLLQAHRDLTDEEMEKVTAPVRGRVEIMGRAIGLLLRPNEDLVEYALRLKDVLEAASANSRSKAAVPEAPASHDEPEPPAGPGPSAPVPAAAAPPDIPPDALTAELDQMVKDLVDTTLPVSGAQVEEKPAKKKGGRSSKGSG